MLYQIHQEMISLDCENLQEKEILVDNLYTVHIIIIKTKP